MEQSIDGLLGLFEEKDGYLRKLNKDVYEANTESFKEVYGKYVDSINGQNSIGVVPEDILMGSYEQLQNWGKDNFSNFEDKLEKYNFVFVKKNGKINLIDFYVD